MSEIKSFSALQSDLHKRKYVPIYFLHGEESYYIDEITKYIEHEILNETDKAFNLTVLYGKDIDFKTVLDNVKRYPVMAERQVVIIKEAQDLKTLDSLAPYFENPLDTTLLVLAHKHKSLDKRKKYVKTLEKSDKVALFESAKLKDQEVAGWIRDYLARATYKAADNVVEMLAQYLGNDLSKISNELDKLMLNVPASTPLTLEHVQKNIGISKDYNLFELQAAMGRKDHTKAQQIVRYFIGNPKENPLPVVVGILYSYFSKLYMLSFHRQKSDREIEAETGIRSFFLRDYKGALAHYNRTELENAIKTLHEYDLRSKGIALHYKDDLLFSDSTEYDGLLTELVYKIMNGV